MPNGMLLSMVHGLAWLVLLIAAAGFVVVLIIGLSPAREMVKRLIRSHRAALAWSALPASRRIADVGQCVMLHRGRSLTALMGGHADGALLWSAPSPRHQENSRCRIACQ